MWILLILVIPLIIVNYWTHGVARKRTTLYECQVTEGFYWSLVRKMSWRVALVFCALPLAFAFFQAMQSDRGTNDAFSLAVIGCAIYPLLWVQILLVASGIIRTRKRQITAIPLQNNEQCNVPYQPSELHKLNPPNESPYLTISTIHMPETGSCPTEQLYDLRLNSEDGSIDFRKVQFVALKKEKFVISKDSCEIQMLDDANAMTVHALAAFERGYRSCRIGGPARILIDPIIGTVAGHINSALAKKRYVKACRVSYHNETLGKVILTISGNPILIDKIFNFITNDHEGRKSFDVKCPYCGNNWKLDNSEAQQQEISCPQCNRPLPWTATPNFRRSQQKPVATAIHADGTPFIGQIVEIGRALDEINTSSQRQQEQPASTIETLQGTPALWFYVNEQKIGPYTTGELRERLSTGQISEETLCWQEGWDDWKPVRHYILEAFKKPHLVGTNNQKSIIKTESALPVVNNIGAPPHRRITPTIIALVIIFTCLVLGLFHFLNKNKATSIDPRIEETLTEKSPSIETNATKIADVDNKKEDEWAVRHCLGVSLETPFLLSKIPKDKLPGISSDVQDKLIDLASFQGITKSESCSVTIFRYVWKPGVTYNLDDGVSGMINAATGKSDTDYKSIKTDIDGIEARHVTYEDKKYGYEIVLDIAKSNHTVWSGLTPKKWAL